MKTKIKYSILLSLAVLFSLPGILAYFFYQHPGLLGSARVNKGILLQPVIPLTTDDLQGWQLVFWSPASCDNLCLRQLDTLARVRLALGRRSYEVQLILLLGKEAKPLKQPIQDLLKNRAIVIERAEPSIEHNMSAAIQGSHIFITNPNHAAILQYQPTAKAQDIYQDLNRLLATSQSKGAM